jgi:hypothetical protein
MRPFAARPGDSCPCGARRWIARIMVTWALLSLMTAWVTTPMTFYVVRFLLGVAEAGFTPAYVRAGLDDPRRAPRRRHARAPVACQRVSPGRRRRILHLRVGRRPDRPVVARRFTRFRRVLHSEPGGKESRAPRPAPGSAHPCVPTRVPRPDRRLPAPKCRRCAPCSRCTARR